MNKFLLILVLILVLTAASIVSLRAQTIAPGRFDGVWEWRGEIGWQRLALNLKEDRGKLTGTVKMGPGPAYGSTDSADFWEFFFYPLTTAISNGTVRGDTIVFEQILRTERQRSNLGDIRDSTPPVSFKYTGKLDGTTLRLTRELHLDSTFLLSARNQKFEIAMSRPGMAQESLAPIRSESLPLSTTGTIEVSVKDSSGRFVASLRREDFEIAEGGVSRSIQSMAGPDSPWNIVFLFDLDALLLDAYSTSGDPALADRGPENAMATWKQLGDGLTQFYKSLRSQDRFRIDLFNDRIATMLDWRTGGQRGEWTTSKISLPTLGNSGTYPEKDFYGAIRSVLARLRDGKGRKAVVVLTDGRDGRMNFTHLYDPDRAFLDPFYGVSNEAEKLEFEQLCDAVRKSGVQLFVAIVNGDRTFQRKLQAGNPFTAGMNLVPEAAQNFPSLGRRIHDRLEQLAEVSGGAVFARENTAGAASAMATLAERIRLGRSYGISYSNSASGTAAGDIQVRGKNPGLLVERMKPGLVWSTQ